MIPSTLDEFLTSQHRAVIVHVAGVEGSTPREEGAWMLVGPSAIHGTIGGGQMEFMAIAHAQKILAGEEQDGSYEIPLGPEIGQCCGGRVTLDLHLLDEQRRGEVAARAATETAARPEIYIFGAGHVGTALARALSLLPVRTVVVETRADALDGIEPPAETRLTAVPEEAVREAKPGAAFVVLTHDHALDFLIVAEALARDDAAYVGMIGSKTKRASFKSWYLKHGGTEDRLARLTCPIGGAHVRDKRPAVIAALAAAEVVATVVKTVALSEQQLD